MNPLKYSAALCAVFSFLQTAPAEIVVDIDVTGTKMNGAAPTISNTGTTAGDFVAGGDTPVIANVAGVQAITLDGANDYYVGPPPPAGVTGFDPTRSIEVWVYNPEVGNEETMVAWGRRGGPDGTNISFGYGTNGAFGAVGHWGAPDIGWDSATNANVAAAHPAPAEWHHLVYTYDPIEALTTVYIDGVEANSEPDILLDTHVEDDAFNPLPIVIGAQNLAAGGQDVANQGSLSIARVRIHDTVLTPAEVSAVFAAESPDFVALVDSDGDGLDDRWEIRQFGDLAQDDVDSDGDTLINSREFELGTCANLVDTDGDTINDNLEVDRIDPQTGEPAPTNPLLADSDGDGLNDNVETDTGMNAGAADRETDPLNADTDGDEFSDKVEIDGGSDPFNVNSIPVIAPVIVLDATGLPEGELGIWENTGLIPGDFDSTDDGFNPEVVTTDGVKGVEFFGDDYYVGPVAPTNMTGNGSRSIAAWVYNPDIVAEETVFAWGRRGGPDGTNMSFNHGTHDAFGAVGHWGGGPDVGWDSEQDAGDDLVGGDDQEIAGAWTNITYTYNGTTNTTSVYTNGRLTRADVNGPLNTHAVDDIGEPLRFVVAAQNEANGLASLAGYNGSLVIGVIEAWDQSLPVAAVQSRYNDRAASFGLGLIADSDSNGLDDDWEINNFGAIGQDPDSDASDSDNLSNLGEFLAGTDPNDPDTDGDGVLDGDELNRMAGGNPAPTDPLNPDSDGDGLSDGGEVTAGTDPLQQHSDGDIFNDYVEVLEGSDPTDTASIPMPEVITPVNRYSFDETTGTVVTDSLGGANGTIIGTGFTHNGGSLSLAGGVSTDTNAAYIDLPNGLVSSKTDITVEVWFTLDGSQNWSRIFDFGSSSAGELTEHGGTGDGQDYFMVSAQIGGDINMQRWEVDALGVINSVDTTTPTTLGEEFSVALVFDSDGNLENDPLNPGLISAYRDGILLGALATDEFFLLQDILDDNVWLGRSNWTADNNTAGTYNEVRIYDEALSYAQVILSNLAGPNVPFEGGGGDPGIAITNVDFDESTREIVVTWSSEAGATYAIDSSPDLATPFTVLSDNIASGGATTQTRVPAGDAERLFIVVRELEAP